jgi:hypothetical protein
LFAFLNVHPGSKAGFSKQAVKIMHMVQPLRDFYAAGFPQDR